MNIIRKILPALLLMSCSSGHIVTTNLHNLASFEENSQIYCLPKTRVIVSLVVDKTEFIPGPYQRFAKKYLEIEGAKSSSSNSYVITDIKINTQTIPDPDYCFSIRNEKFGEIETLLNDLRNNGLIMEENNMFSSKQNIENQDQQDNFPYLNIKPFSSDEFLMVRGDISEVQDFSDIPFLKKEVALKTLEQKAEAAANFLFKLRKRRFYLMTGKYGVIPEGVALESSLEEINKLEQEYLSLFVGKTKTTSIRRNFTIIPNDIDKIQQFTLLRFSNETGFNTVEGNVGETLVLQLTDLETNKTLSQLQRAGSSTQYYDIIHYRVADWANAKILFGSHEILESEISIYQFGAVLPKYISPAKN